MEWMIVAGLVGASGYFVVRHIRATLRGEEGKGCGCGGNCGTCVSCHSALGNDEKSKNFQT